jgi:pimeloyl-ACP methyl ester carboxylesterase
MATFTTNDQTERYDTDSHTAGPVLLMAHGDSCTSRFFRKNVDALAQTCRVIAIDLRGHGHSNHVTKGPRVSRLAQDVHELLQGLNLDDVTYLGWSMGCAVGWCYFDLFGDDWLKKFIFVDEPALAASDPDNPTGAMSYDALSAFQVNMTQRPKPTIETFQRSFLYKKELDIDDLIAASQLSDGPFLGQLIFNHHVTDWRDVISTITLPSLIIAGENSLVNWHSTKAVADMILCAWFEWFDDAGHMLFFEYPEKFNAMVSVFVTA